MELSEYDFSFKHIPGKQNVLADFLSRNAQPSVQDLTSHPDIVCSDEVLPVTTDTNDLHNEINVLYQNINKPVDVKCTNSDKLPQDDKNSCQVNCLSLETSTERDPLLEISDTTILNEQKKDPKLNKIIMDLQENVDIEKHKGYYINPSNNILCYNNFFSFEEIELHRAVLPPSLIPKALTIAHITHTGINKTLQNLRKRFTWKTIIADTQNFVNSCELCIIHKNRRKKIAPFMAAPVPTAPNQKISLDIVGPLINHASVLTIIDHFSRHLELYIIHNVSASTVTSALINYIATHGRPDVVLSDKGSQFTSDIFSYFNKTLGIKLRHITIAHPAANGLSERVNSQIKSSLNTMTAQGFDIKTAAKIHQSIYNATVHPATKFTPNFLHFGREINDVYMNYKGHPSRKILNTAHDIYKLTELLDKVYHQSYINNEANRQKVYEKSRQQHRFADIKPNDTVFITFPSVFKKKTNGPFIVQKVISPVVLQIKSIKDNNASPMLIHTNRVIKLHARNPNLQYDVQQNSPNENSEDKAATASTSTNVQPQQLVTNVQPQPPNSSYCLRQNRKKFVPYNDFQYY